MGLQINTNVNALNAYRNLTGTQGSMTTSLERLSSGLRINRAADDAAGLAISEKLRSQVNGLNQAQANAQDGVSLIQTAEGALNETHAILQRMRTLAVQSASDTNTDADRAAIQKEIDALVKEIDSTTERTQFNGMNLLDGTFSGKALQIGANSGQTMEIQIGSLTSKALNLSERNKVENTVVPEPLARTLTGGPTTEVATEVIGTTATATTWTTDGLAAGEYRVHNGQLFLATETDLTTANAKGTIVGQTITDSGTGGAKYTLNNSAQQGDLVTIAGTGATSAEFEIERGGAKLPNADLVPRQEWASGTASAAIAQGTYTVNAAGNGLTLNGVAVTGVSFTDDNTFSISGVTFQFSDDLKAGDELKLDAEIASGDSGAAAKMTVTRGGMSDTPAYTPPPPAETNGPAFFSTNTGFGDGLAAGTYVVSGGNLYASTDTDFETSLGQVEGGQVRTHESREYNFAADLRDGDKFTISKDAGGVQTVSGITEVSPAPSGTTAANVAGARMVGQVAAGDYVVSSDAETTGANAGRLAVLNGDDVVGHVSRDGMSIAFNDGSSISFQSQVNASSSFSVAQYGASESGRSIDLTTREGAVDALGAIDAAINKISNQRADLGALQNRLTHTINNLGVSAENLAASESRIRDTDMAKEMTNFTRSQILQQAGISMLAQANQSTQGVLKLLG